MRWTPFPAVFALALNVVADASLPDSKTRVKAEFLIHFTQFVHWPPHAFPAEDSPFIIGLYGEEPFGPYLDGLLAAERLGNRSILAWRPKNPEEARDCQLLYVAPSESRRLGVLLASLRGHPVLTVGESEAFLIRGGMIAFILENGDVRIRIRPEKAREAGLSIRAKLLRMAQSGKGN